MIQVEKYTSEMINLMDTYDEDGDGKFEMSELAKVLKLEENFLEDIIDKTFVTDRDTKVKQVSRHVTFCYFVSNFFEHKACTNLITPNLSQSSISLSFLIKLKGRAT